MGYEVWVPALVAALGSTGAAVQANQQAKAQQGQANEAQRSARAQAQAQAEQAPELSSQAGLSDAVKKNKVAYGIQENLIASNNMQNNQTLGNKEQWG